MVSTTLRTSATTTMTSMISSKPMIAAMTIVIMMI